MDKITCVGVYVCMKRPTANQGTWIVFCLLVFIYLFLNLGKRSREMFPPNNGEPGSPDDHNASDWSASK